MSECWLQQCEENILDEYCQPRSKQRKSSLNEQDVSIARARLRPSLPYHLSAVSFPGCD